VTAGSSGATCFCWKPSVVVSPGARH